MASPYDRDLDKNPANYQPLTPISYLERAAKVFPGHIAILEELLFARLSADDVDALADILGRVRDHMRHTPPRSAVARRRRAAASEGGIA